MVVFGRWLVSRLEPAFHLVEWELYVRLIRYFVKDKTQIEAIEAEIHEGAALSRRPFSPLFMGFFARRGCLFGSFSEGQA